MNSRPVLFRAFLTLSFLITALTAIFLSAPQQPEGLPVGGIRVPSEAQVQEIEPPSPDPGQGIDFTIRAIDGSSGQPLARMRIELKRNPIINSPQAAADHRRWTYSAATDGEGAATLTNLIADRYSIKPVLDGWTQAKGGTDSVSLSTQTKPAPITIRMFQSSRVDGTIQDSDGNPVPDTIVEILEENWIAGLRELDRTQNVKADQEGKFEFAGVLPGTYYVRARPANGVVQQQLKASAQASEAERRTAFADTLYPNALFMEQAQPLSLSGGTNLLGLRLEMQKTKYYSLSGHVGGIPAEAQKFSGLVLIRRVGFDSPFPFIWKSPYDGAISVQIMPDGTFKAPNVPPGPYWAGYTPAGAVRGGSQFEISDRDVDDFRFEVDKSAVLKGKAVFDDGTPVTGLSVDLGVFVPNMGIYERGFFVDRNSAFTTDGMPAGTWRMEVANMVVRTVDIDGQTFHGNKFDLNPYSGDALITLSRQGASIQGSVELHDRARAYPHGMVTLYPVPQHPTDVPKRRFLTGNANFTMDHLDPGQYRVCAWLEEGGEVNSMLGNPRYEQKLAAACETVPVSTDEHKSVHLKQISAADLR